MTDPWGGYKQGLAAFDAALSDVKTDETRRKEMARQERLDTLNEPYLQNRNEMSALQLEDERDKRNRLRTYRTGLSSLEESFTPDMTEQDKNRRRVELAFKSGTPEEISRLGTFIDVTNKLDAQGAEMLTKWSTSVGAFRKQFGPRAATEYGYRLAEKMGIPRTDIQGIDFTASGDVFRRGPNDNWFLIQENGVIHEFKPNDPKTPAHDTIKQYSPDGMKFREMQFNPNTGLYDIAATEWAATPKTVESPAAARTAEQTVFRNERDMRRDFEKLPEVKDYGVMTTHFSRLKEAFAEAKATGNKNAADQALINVFNKMMDPSSVVRESEFARTPEYIPWANYIQAKVAKIATGGPGLTNEDRQGIYNMATRFHIAATKNYEKAAGEYRELAKKHKLDPDAVVFRSDSGTASGDKKVDDILDKIKKGEM